MAFPDAGEGGRIAVACAVMPANGSCVTQETATGSRIAVIGEKPVGQRDPPAEGHRRVPCLPVGKSVIPAHHAQDHHPCDDGHRDGGDAG